MEIKDGLIHLSNVEQNRTGYPSPMPLDMNILLERYAECQEDFNKYNEQMSIAGTDLTPDQRAVLPQMGRMVIEREQFLNQALKELSGRRAESRAS